ncbi:MAG: DUF1330 domain-containing protein [Pseudomonadales bacterium]
MTAYVIFNYLQVHDEQRIIAYRQQAHPTVALHGGRVIIRPGALDNREGVPSQYLIVTEFDDLTAARNWYDSDEYQQARKLREGAADVQVIITEGVNANPSQ